MKTAKHTDAAGSTWQLLFGLHLLGLRRRRLDVVLSLLILTAMVASRVVAFPASIWEQDEAYFASAVVALDVADHHPHPPWFPLWITAGRLVKELGQVESARALQLVSAVFSTWMIFPLVGFWSAVLNRREAVLAALLFSFVPAPWWFAGRAFTGTAASALLILALALWNHGSRARIGAGLAAGLAVLVRPHFVVVLGFLAAYLAWKSKRRSELLWPALSAAATVLCGLIALVMTVGGPTPLMEAFSEHWGYHFGRLEQAGLGFADSGFARSLISPWAAALWLGLVLVGAWRTRKSGTAHQLALLSLGALLVVALLFSNPAHARYYVPVLALSSGFAVAGCARFAAVVVPALIAVSTLWLAPQLEAYRTTSSPPLRALREAAWEAHRMDGVIVVDRSLKSFVDYEKACGRLGSAVVSEQVIELGATAPPPPSFTVAVFDQGGDALLLDAAERRSVTTTIPAARRLAQDRFIDLSLAVRAELDNPMKVEGPFTLLR